MSLKNIIKPYHLMIDGDMATSLTSNVVDVTYTDNVGIQLNFTGAPIGTFAVQGSVDYNDITASGNWSELAFSTTPEATGSSGVHLLNLNQIPYKKIRITYTRTSGTGALNIYVMSKGLN